MLSDAPSRKSPDVAAAFAAFPQPVRLRLLEVRRLIFATAAQTSGVGSLTETLKWGEPAYLTAATGSGSTIRLGRSKSMPDMGVALFNCRTTLVDTFRKRFPAALAFQGHRAILLDPSAALPTGPFSICVALALTYHRRHTAWNCATGRAERSAASASRTGTPTDRHW